VLRNPIRNWRVPLGGLLVAFSAFADGSVSGKVVDPQGRPVPAAAVTLENASGYAIRTAADDQGNYRFQTVPDGSYRIRAEAPGLSGEGLKLSVSGKPMEQDVTLSHLAAQHQSIVISASPVEPQIELRNAESFNRTLFTRDDQVFEQLDAGIDAGQHEGGGKSLEIRRFGFNLEPRDTARATWARSKPSAPN